MIIQLSNNHVSLVKFREQCLFACYFKLKVQCRDTEYETKWYSKNLKSIEQTVFNKTFLKLGVYDITNIQIQDVTYPILTVSLCCIYRHYVKGVVELHSPFKLIQVIA